MDIASIILISIGLAMDCFAVSISKGIEEKHWCNTALLMACLFGLFQGIMPLIGYYAGRLFTDVVIRFAPWIALGLLGIIGGKMIWESLYAEDEEKRVKNEDITGKNVKGSDWSILTLLALSVATSIDALATGVIFVPIPQVIWFAIIIIGLTSFAFSVIGYMAGISVGRMLRMNVKLIGGLILVGIGIKIWVEGMFF